MKKLFIFLLMQVSVLAQASLSASPSSVNFGYVEVNSFPRSEYIYITNNSKKDITLNISSGCGSDYYLNYGTCGYGVKAGSNCYVRLEFNPHMTGAMSCGITVYGSDSSSVFINAFGIGEAKH